MNDGLVIWHRHRWLGWIVRYPDGKRRWCLKESTADRLVDTYVWPTTVLLKTNPEDA